MEHLARSHGVRMVRKGRPRGIDCQKKHKKKQESIPAQIENDSYGNTCCRMSDQDTDGMGIDNFLHLDRKRINVWTSLPGMPGNSVKLIETTTTPGVEQLFSDQENPPLQYSFVLAALDRTRHWDEI